MSTFGRLVRTKLKKEFFIGSGQESPSALLIGMLVRTSHLAITIIIRAVNRNNSDSDFEYNSVFRHLLDSNSNSNSKPLQIPIQMNSFTD